MFIYTQDYYNEIMITEIVEDGGNYDYGYVRLSYNGAKMKRSIKIDSEPYITIEGRRYNLHDFVRC